MVMGSFSEGAGRGHRRVPRASRQAPGQLSLLLSGGTLKDELAEKARALWQDIGGSNEGWQAWFNRKELFGQLPGVQAGLTWLKIEKRLPEFELSDLSGAKWRLADLKGKTTLITIWATW